MSSKFVANSHPQMIRSFVFSTSLVLSAAAAAQQSAAPQAGTEEELVEVVIVGSQIRGAKITEVLPVTVVDKEDIVATAAVSGDDLYRSIPQAGDVTFQEARTTGNLNDARGDTSSINLRSLGTGNTLMLLNGRRVVPAPGTQTENFVPVQTANTNAFPVAGVKRVEVLRDGAAAIYGTDAVAGVVNTVLESDFEGLRMEAQYGGSEGTPHRETTVNLKAGTRFENGTALRSTRATTLAIVCWRLTAITQPAKIIAGKSPIRPGQAIPHSTIAAHRRRGVLSRSFRARWRFVRGRRRSPRPAFSASSRSPTRRRAAAARRTAAIFACVPARSREPSIANCATTRMTIAP